MTGKLDPRARCGHHTGMYRFAFVLAFAMAVPVAADARSEKSLAYPRSEAWATAVRFLRIDEHLKIIEKDADAGYVLFELREEKKIFRGSLELIEFVKEGRRIVRFVVTIEDRPTWIEIGLLNRLERKLRLELGSPSPAPSPKPKKDDSPKDPKPSEPSADPKPEDPRKEEGPPISATP